MDAIIVTPKNKNSIPFLKHLLTNLSDVEKVEVVSMPQNKTEESIQAGLQDLKDIISGKIQGKSIKQLLNDD
jgi:hypothetical protein